MTQRAFLTGSRVYGIPRTNSDIDLVVLLSPEDIEALQDAPGVRHDSPNEYDAQDAMSLRFGSLNLLCVEDERHFEVWRQGTLDLEARKPVTREEACEYLGKLRKEAMIDDAWKPLAGW